MQFKNIILVITLVILLLIQVDAYKDSIARKKSNSHQRNKGSKRQEKSITTQVPDEPDFDSNSIIPIDPFNLNENFNSKTSSNIMYIYVILGQNVVLPCTVKNLGSYNILWLRLKDGDVLAYDNMTVTQDSRFKLIKKTENESNLMIEETKLADSGEYACQINTQAVKSRIVNLMVLKSPVFSEIELSHEVPDHHYAHLALAASLVQNKTENRDGDYLAAKSINVVEGKQIILECNAFGQPKPTINWYVKRFKSDNLTVYILNSSKIYVNNVMRNQYDYFECEATNKVPPSVSKKFKINVLYRPEINVSPSKVYVVQLPTQVRFNCTVDSYPSGEIVWMFNYRNLRGINYHGAKQLRQINRHSIKNSKYRKKDKKYDFTKNSYIIRRSVYDLSFTNTSGFYNKYRITENIVNETIKQSSIVINIENENDFGAYECYSNNTAGSKFMKFYIYGDSSTVKTTTASFKQQETVSSSYVSPTTLVKNIDLFKDEIVIPRREIMNGNDMYMDSEYRDDIFDNHVLNSKNINEQKLVNFSTNFIKNYEDSKKSILEYVFGDSNELASSLSSKPYASFLIIYSVNFLIVLYPLINNLF